MKEKLLAGLLSALMLLSLVGCGGKDSLPEGGVAPYEDIPDQKITETEYDPNYSKEGKNKPFIDYAVYDDYGEWCCDRMWVRKTEKTWDSVAEYFGYLDRDGSLVGEWHPVKQDLTAEYNYRDLQEAYAALDQPGISEWEFCRDFVGGFALNSIGTYQDSDGMYTATYCPMLEIVNRNGEIVHSFIPLDYAGPDKYSALKYEFNFVNYLPIFYASTAAVWNADGSYAGESPAMYIIFPEDDDVREVLIEGSTGEKGFYNVDHFYYELSNREFINGYCSMISSIGDRAYLFDENGKTVFEVEFDYRITKLYAKDDIVYMHFIGADKETSYCVEMDFDGNWLTEPTPAS